MRRRAGVLAVLAVVAVTSCSAERGRTLPSPSGNARVSASPTASPRALTRAEIEAQALAAVRAYYAEANRALATGDTRDLARMMSSRCTCRPLLEYVEDRWSRGTVTGSGYALDAVSVHSSSIVEVRVRIRYSVSEFEERDRQGRVTARIPAIPPTTADVQVVRAGNFWVIDDIAKFGDR